MIGNIHQVVGQTPLIYLKHFSEQTGCHIWGKAEYLNPGGSVKDRTALGIILDAQAKGLLKPDMTLVEGTAGNTGIGLATLAAQMGYRCVIVMPNNQSTEKYQTLSALGAEVIAVPPCPFSNLDHFYHQAQRIAASKPDCFWVNQFENTANFDIHYKTTGKEIWEQTQGKINMFVSASGTGGTIAGVSNYLKEQNPQVKVALVDPMGSGLHSYFTHGKFEATGSSMTEGIGIMRLTANMAKAKIDETLQIEDQEMLDTLYALAKYEGLIVGTSAALNVAAAIRLANRNKQTGSSIVTILCDSGLRYQSRIFNADFIKQKGLCVPSV